MHVSKGWKRKEQDNKSKETTLDKDLVLILNLYGQFQICSIDKISHQFTILSQKIAYEWPFTY